MNCPKFLFIDNDDVSDHIESLEKNKRIRVEPLEPAKSLMEIKRKIKDDIENIDGIIFDWGLKDGNHRLEYSSPALAQDLSNIIGESHVFKFIPFVVITGQKYRSEIEENQHFSYLFNRVYGKDQISTNTEQLVNELYSLAIGYKKLREPDSNIIDLVFGEHEKDLTALAYLDSFKNKHEKAIFIQNEVVITPGIFVNESLLAARLGIDKEKSKGWNILLKEFQDNKFLYNGIFSEGWTRWWFNPIEEWFYKNTNSYLNTLPARERVEKIHKITGINELTEATPIEGSYSTFFWTVCKVINKPIDPLDGFCILNRHVYEWQDKTYVSKQAALENRHKDIGLKLYPDEEKQLLELQGIIIQ